MSENTSKNEEIQTEQPQEEVFPWVEERNFDEEIYLGYWENKPIIINVDFGSCFLSEGQGLSVGDGEFFATVKDGKWDIKEASSFKKGILPANSILEWDSSDKYHKALGVISDEEKETQRMMEMIQAQMANMPKNDDDNDADEAETAENADGKKE